MGKWFEGLYDNFLNCLFSTAPFTNRTDDEVVLQNHWFKMS